MRGPGRPDRADEPDVPAGTSAQRLTGFLPARDGFAFTNSWPPAPAVCVRTPAGPVGIGNAALGLCGGMVLAALDYWHAGMPPPASRPAPGSPLYRFIVRRLIASWRIPAGVAMYYGWMVLPDRDAVLRAGTGPGAARTIRGVPGRSVAVQWPRVRAALDRGQPVPLGLVTVASVSPLLLGRNHQVLACSYQAARTSVRLQVYDPNTGQDDGVFLEFDTGRPAITHNIGIARPVRGFFTTRCVPVPPPEPA